MLLNTCEGVSDALSSVKCTNWPLTAEVGLELSTSFKLDFLIPVYNVVYFSARN